MSEKLSRRDTDWFEHLKDEEKKSTEDGKTAVLLRGLIRLADLAGKTTEEMTFGNSFVIPTKNGHHIFAQVKYVVNFNDGTSWTGAADCHLGNCRELGIYPTAVAESRAYARALRKALGIADLAAEEFDENADAGFMTGKVEPNQIRAIEALMTRKKIPVKQVIEQVCARENIFSIQELTWEEAQRASRYLNDYKVKK